VLVNVVQLGKWRGNLGERLGSKVRVLVVCPSAVPVDEWWRSPYVRVAATMSRREKEVEAIV
jgi:hypothetical protein